MVQILDLQDGTLQLCRAGPLERSRHAGSRQRRHDEHGISRALQPVGMLAAPLMAGNDLRSMTPEIRDILTNKEVIAVDQDPLGRQGPPGEAEWRSGSMGASAGRMVRAQWFV